MSGAELVITNAPPISVRARYEKEARGFIKGKNGKNIQLQVKNIYKFKDLKGAKCTAEIKSVANRQVHGYYCLSNNEWSVSAGQNGTGTANVDVDPLAVFVKGRSKPTPKQNKDRGHFYLEFTLIFADGSIGPACRTDNMLDISCREYCPPKIKRICPQVGVGGEKVLIQCANQVARNKLVEAIFSVTIGDRQHNEHVECQVDGNLIELVLPYLYHIGLPNFPNEDVTEMKVKIRVDKNNYIASESVPFGYLAEKFRRPDVINENVPKKNIPTPMEQSAGMHSGHSLKTFDSLNLHQWASTNTEIDFVTGLIPPKNMSLQNRIDFDQSKRFQSPKAFHETQNQSQDEKNMETPKEVVLSWTESKTIEDTAPEEQHDVAVVLPSSCMTEFGKQQLNQPMPYPQHFPDGIEPQGHVPSNPLSNNFSNISLSRNEQECYFTSMTITTPELKQSKSPPFCYPNPTQIEDLATLSVHVPDLNTAASGYGLGIQQEFGVRNNSDSILTTITHTQEKFEAPQFRNSPLNSQDEYPNQGYSDELRRFDMPSEISINDQVQRPEELVTHSGSGSPVHPRTSLQLHTADYSSNLSPGGDIGSVTNSWTKLLRDLEPVHNSISKLAEDSNTDISAPDNHNPRYDRNGQPKAKMKRLL